MVQLAMRVIRAKGFSKKDKVLAQTIALRVIQTLLMRARRGTANVAAKHDECAKSDAKLMWAGSSIGATY